MSDADAAVLGRVVFGTSRGLFALGTGVLAGAADSADAFELRSANPRRSLVPAPDRPVLLRRALRLSTVGHVDLIAVVNGASDLEKRPGFLGYGIAVEYGDAEAYELAMEFLWEEFRPAFEHYAPGNRFREGASAYAVPGAGRSAMPSLLDAGRKTPPILLTLPNWWDHPEFVTDLLDASARWSGREAATILIGTEERAESFPATVELLDRMNEETEARAEMERKAEDAAALERAGINLGQDHIARRKIQRLEEQLRGQDRRVAALERRIHMLSAAPMAPIEPPEDPRPVLLKRVLISAVAAVMVMAVLGLALFLRPRGVDAVAEADRSRQLTIDTGAVPAGASNGPAGAAPVPPSR